MKEKEIKTLVEKGTFDGNPIQDKIVETHISWVLFTNDFVFKIKKPIKLSFLDYSSLALRKKYCEKEIALNSRYTDIYLTVMPIRKLNDRWFIGNDEGTIVDYAVQMKRMDSSREMDKLLEEGKINKQQIDALAGVVSDFHLNAEKVHTPFDIEKAKKTFNDILEIKELVNELDPNHSEILENSINWSDQFLDQHANRLQERIDCGFKRDVHGDLHSGNVFLYERPVLFDCIEFNDQFRQIDLLYEIAFMCMDLESFGEQELADQFLSSYTEKLNCFKQKEDESIFVYFKCLRANIRAKVEGINLGQSENIEEKENHIGELKKYLNLMKGYMTEIN